MRTLPLLIIFPVIVFCYGCGHNNAPANDQNIRNMESSTSTTSKNFTSGYKTVNGIEMYYEIHGIGKPLVLIHGGGSTINTSFGRALPLFAKNRKVIAVELQAHGHTSDRNAPESFEQDADDVAELLKQLNISKVDILGFSNGGSTSLQVAIRHPQLVNKIVPISAIYKRSGMQEGFWDFMKKGTLSELPQAYKDEFLKINGDKDKLVNMFHRDQERMLTFKDWPDELLRSIRVPALIVVGDKDVVRPEHALEIAHLIPNARLAVLPGGHGDFIGEIMAPDPNSKMPALTVSMIEEFLDAVPKNKP